MHCKAPSQRPLSDPSCNTSDTISIVPPSLLLSPDPCESARLSRNILPHSGFWVCTRIEIRSQWTPATYSPINFVGTYSTPQTSNKCILNSSARPTQQCREAHMSAHCSTDRSVLQQRYKIAAAATLQVALQGVPVQWAQGPADPGTTASVMDTAAIHHTLHTHSCHCMKGQDDTSASQCPTTGPARSTAAPGSLLLVD